MGTSEKRIDTCAGGTGAAGAWESTKLEGLFLAVLLDVTQRARGRGDGTWRSASAYFLLSIYDDGDSEFITAAELCWPGRG